ncbi:biotin--[acetyl-CoA-carboxylase] ligase [Corynebacterium sp. HMSC074C04]|nr:biotin--[acetyl-CoA-carboxylase] ligase [Corynebacterium sp. HMSC074C04]
MRAAAPGWSSIEVVETTGSTNADLRKQAALGQVADLSALIASEQTAGRGRLSRSWTAPEGASIALSTLLRPQGLAPEQLGLLPLVAGLAVVDAVVEVVGLVPERVSLKWPNDVLVDGRKLCGILVEAASLTPPALIPGIGINVSLQEDELPVPHATSLYLAGADNLDRDDISAGVLRALGRRQAQWRKGDAELLRDYEAVCATIGSNVRVELPGDRVLVGKAVGVRADGELIVTDEAGTSHFVAAGDVFHVRATDGGYGSPQTDSDRR